MFEKILKFFSAENKNPAEAEKSQKFNIIVIGVGLFAILFFLMLLVGEDNNTNQKDIGKFQIVNENEAVKTKWIGQVAPQVEISNEKVSKVIEQNNLLKEEIQNLKKIIIQMKKNQNNKSGQQNNTPNFQNNSNLYQNYPLPPKPNQANSQNKNSFINNINPQDVGLEKLGKVPVLQKKIIVKEEPVSDALQYAAIAQPEKPKKEEKPITPINMISTGTISKVLLLGGMDAPTMARAKSNPLPVLMKVTDPSFLPNDWREDIQGCFFLGEGYGDLSSERAYIRVTTLSCVTKDGYHIDTSFKGAVYGEDGKVGLRGRVVTKQGALLARSIIAGFLQGVAEAFKQSDTIVSVTPEGSTSTISPQKAFQAGVYGGASEAANKLAEFYLKMADQVAPVIEISAGRRVDVIALEPVKLKPIEFLKKGANK
jgi:conjugal transfer pilus assembly protein TraB